MTKVTKSDMNGVKLNKNFFCVCVQSWRFTLLIVSKNFFAQQQATRYSFLHKIAFFISVCYCLKYYSASFCVVHGGLTKEKS